MCNVCNEYRWGVEIALKFRKVSKLYYDILKYCVIPLTKFKDKSILINHLRG